MKKLSAIKLLSFFVQGGITEEQMLNFMGANTSLSPMQAKDLIEVNVVPVISSQCPSLFFSG